MGPVGSGTGFDTSAPLGCSFEPVELKLPLEQELNRTTTANDQKRVNAVWCVIGWALFKDHIGILGWFLELIKTKE
jgi:hypothetical protein